MAFHAETHHIHSAPSSAQSAPSSATKEKVIELLSVAQTKKVTSNRNVHPRGYFLLIAALALTSLDSFAQVQVNGVSDAASYQIKAAPGGLISIFGSNLATGTASAQALPLPADLLGTTVSINGIAAPLLYVSSAQINAQVPYEVQPDAAANVLVQTPNGNASGTLNVQAAAPAIFTITSTGSGTGAILNTNYSLVMDNNPAQPGQIVQIYATGLGAI